MHQSTLQRSHRSTPSREPGATFRRWLGPSRVAARGARCPTPTRPACTRLRPSRGEYEATDNAPNGDADVFDETIEDEKVPSFAEHRQRIGKERLGDESTEGGDAPGDEEKQEKQDAEDDTGDG